jgi:tetratricopeptide (TPR) repeat protein
MKKISISAAGRSLNLLPGGRCLRGATGFIGRSRYVVLLAFSFALATAETVRGQTAEHEQVKKMVMAETDFYYKTDGNAWQATWLHTAGITRAFVNKDSYAIFKGWENFGPDAIAGLKNWKPSPVKIANSNYNIKTGGSLAWVEYDQTVTGEKDTSTSHEYRVLEKIDGQWKIVSQTTIGLSSYDNTPQNMEYSLNSLGYGYLGEKKVNEAIDVFLLNVKLHPKAANTYDSLGEAYALAGQKELAIKNYEKSVELNPENDNAKEILIKLKKD